MTINYMGLAAIIINSSLYVAQNRTSQIKKEFEKARYNISKKEPNLDAIVQTSNLGDIEIKIIQTSSGKFDLDEINYDSKLRLLGKRNVYNCSTPITPAALKSPLKYKISSRNKNTNIRIFLKYALINGSVRVNIGPDKQGIYQAKKVTIYDSYGKVFHSFVPTPRKPKPAAPILPAQTKTSTSIVKPSP